MAYAPDGALAELDGSATPPAGDDTEPPPRSWLTPIANKQELKTAYVMDRERVPLHPRVIFYETMSGSRVSDNPLAMFEFLRHHTGEYGRFFHVWTVNNDAAIPDEYRDADDVAFVRRGSAAYAYFLARAGRIIGNATLPSFFVRRRDQLYLNTWHGIPYKTLSRSTRGVVIPSGPGVLSFFKATHAITPCRYMTDIQLYSYSLAGSSTVTFAETGYPRVDQTIGMTPQRAREIRRAAGIEGVTTVPRRWARSRRSRPNRQMLRAAVGTGGRPVVLYAPTWRKSDDGEFFDTSQLEADLAALAGLDATVVFRGHHRTDKFVREISPANVIVPPPSVNSNELLAVVDVLITDYSSIFFDFLPTGRPVVHYLYDLAEYESQRGLNLTVDELPGAVAYTQPELLTAVRESLTALAVWRATDRAAARAGGSTSRPPAVRAAPAQLPAPAQGERYAAAQQRFCAHEDGQSTRRAVDFFFGRPGHDVPIIEPRDERPTIAFWAGELTDSKASRQLVAEVHDYLSSGEWQVTLLVGRKTKQHPEGLRAIAELGREVAVVPLDPFKIGMTPAEKTSVGRLRDARMRAKEQGEPEPEPCVEDQELLDRMYRREYRRLLGDAHFDRNVLGPGLSLAQRRVALHALK